MKKKENVKVWVVFFFELFKIFEIKNKISDVFEKGLERVYKYEEVC